MEITEHKLLDITRPKLAVEVEVDRKRGVLYVHVDGLTVLRVCQAPEIIITGGGSEHTDPDTR